MLKALYVILTSLGLAFVFNFLFFGKLIGISVFLFAAIFIAAIFLLGASQISFRKIWWFVLLIGFFAVMPGIRANEFLNFLNICAILGLLMFLSYELVGVPPVLMRIRDYVKLFVFVPFQMLRRGLSTVILVGEVRSNVKNRDVWIRIVRGVVLAVPLLIVFGILFSQADMAFSQFINRFWHIQISERTAQYLVLLVISFVSALSFLSYIFFPKQVRVSEQSMETTPANRSIEVLVFLGLISALFLVFIIFQVTYLFGGQTNIVNAGFTYAEYARHGFFELLVVAILSLLILLASEKYSGAESRRDKLFMIPALILIAEVGIVIVSAFKRLSLYIDAYGMTLLRFYVAGFIILLSALFILLAVKFIMSKREQFFSFGALLAVAGFLIAVDLVNPDAFIIKANINQYNRTGKFDVSYMRELSADAEPWKIELYNRLQGEDKQDLQELLLDEKNKLQKNSQNWQSINLARTKALKLLQEVSN